MFEDCKSLTSLVLPKCGAGEYGMAGSIFNGCAGLTSLGLSEWNVENIELALLSLPDKGSLVHLDVSKADTSGVTDVSGLFRGCSSLESLDVANWDVSRIEDFSSMFSGCSSLTALDLSGWDVSNIRDYSWMFYGCASLRSLDVSGWAIRSYVEYKGMLDGCSSLCSITVGPGFDSLCSALPRGPWYDAAGNYYSYFPHNVSGTYTTYPPVTSGDEELDDASTAPTTPENPVVIEGELDGLTYLAVPEGAVDAAGEAYVLDREYAELGGRYVGAGVYVTAYRGEAADLALPAQIEGADVVSADLSWRGDAEAGIPDPDGRTRLESLSLERGCRLASLDASGSDVAELGLAGDEALGGLPALRFLDLSGTRVPSLDPAPMPALERLALRGCPVGADCLEALSAWSGATGLPADLEGAGAKDEPSEPEQPSEPANPGRPGEPEQPAEPANPDQPGEPEQPVEPEQPAEPASPDQPAEPEQPSNPLEPSEPAVPSESEQPAEPAIPYQPSEPAAPANPDQSEQSAEPE